MSETVVFEEGERLYLVGSLVPSTPAAQDIEEFAFGKSIVEDLRRRAPNEHLTWFGGHYVEADNPNGNGAMWTAGELAIKSLTPMLMPVTVMHDPRTAVGMIADVALKTPENDRVPRPKIETAIALWKHRFPDVVEEALHNYEQGSLMQSMECLAPNYDCGTCGMGYTKLPGGAEQANWCAHLKGEDPSVTPTRILRSVVFTGTGLIFGSRGARGADPQAHLETFQQEVAEFHQRVHQDRAKPRRKLRMETVEINKAEYDELRSRPTRQELDDIQAKLTDAEKAIEVAEAAQKSAEEKAAEAEKKVEVFEEKARQATLRDERFNVLGAAFLAGLGDKTKQRLQSDAAAMSDESWTARLDELEELTGKKRDEGAEEAEEDKKGDDQTFSATEIAKFQAQTSAKTNDEPLPAQRRSVLNGLTK